MSDQLGDLRFDQIDISRCRDFGLHVRHEVIAFTGDLKSNVLRVVKYALLSPNDVDWLF